MLSFGFSLELFSAPNGREILHFMGHLRTDHQRTRLFRQSQGLYLHTLKDRSRNGLLVRLRYVGKFAVARSRSGASMCNGMPTVNHPRVSSFPRSLCICLSLRLSVLPPLCRSARDSPVKRAAAKRSDRSVGSNATTAYYTSLVLLAPLPCASLAPCLFFHLLSSLVLSLSLSSFPISLRFLLFPLFRNTVRLFFISIFFYFFSSVFCPQKLNFVCNS